MQNRLSLKAICGTLAMVLAGCGSSGPSNSAGTGGSSGSGGAMGTGGAGTGGSAAGTGGAGTGGAPGTGGTMGTGGGTPDAGPADAPADNAGNADGGAWQFKSAGLVMMGDMLVFPPRHSAPMNVSPPFSWGTGPAGTMSYAITMFDTKINNPHFAMWDIPATETGLPANIPHTAMPGAPAPAGMKQTANGFQGPGGPNVNTYELRLWALKVATLPNPGANAGAIRMRLIQDMMGPKTLVIDSQIIMAFGTRGGIGTDPPM
jgi:phosphatidylethanolamine-binding protein (PEBP) family uncharacterized protein